MADGSNVFRVDIFMCAYDVYMFGVRMDLMVIFGTSNGRWPSDYDGNT